MSTTATIRDTAACCSPATSYESASVDRSDADAVRASVRAQYAAVAVGETNSEGCCGPACGGDANDGVNFIGDGYVGTDGYLADADLQLGCGVPTDLAELAPGDTVLDLGSGAGVDAFIARRVVGDDGFVIGVDMTPEMVEKARTNTEALGYTNVAFRLGEIEALPVESDSIDVAISNCVLNLVPDKAQAFAEMARVLKPGGHFCVSDVVTRGALPASVKRSAELWAGCVAGAMDEGAYLEGLGAVGFEEVEVRAAHPLDLPDAALAAFLSPDELGAYRASGGGLYSVTVFGVKPISAG